jgi:hypothetical protein
VDNKLASCLFACGISFNVVWSFYWHDMVGAINNGPKVYKSLNYEKVRTTSLAQERALVKCLVQI